jgi:hypothetical protein
MGFEPTISADEQPQTYALDRAAAGTGSIIYYLTLLQNTEVCVEMLTLHVTASCVRNVIIGRRKLESVIQGLCTILHESRSGGSKIEMKHTPGP